MRIYIIDSSHDNRGSGNKFLVPEIALFSVGFLFNFPAGNFVLCYSSLLFFTQQLLAVTHIQHLLAARKMMSQWCCFA